MPPIPPVSEPDDSRWMAAALALARGARGRVWPNPPVGCVITRHGAPCARGVTQPGGRPHAERVALAAAGELARGAMLYVTLEPCSHWGRTPPCADAIIAAGVARVVAALRDPDPRVDGRGFAKLREAGIAVTVGPGAAEAREIMSGFLHRIRTGQPQIVPVEPADTPPEALDALLRSHEEGMELILRDGAGFCHAERLKPQTPGLLEALGQRGLTSIAIPRDDPLLQRLIPRTQNARAH